jgi:molecular chaperone DnaJ
MSKQSKTISVQNTNGHRQTVDIEIPRGVQNGSQIKYSGLGDNFFESLPRGDLYVVINVEHDPRYEIHDLDLVYDIQVNCFEAILGQTIDVPSIEDKIFQLNVPAGTQSGAIFRIPNQGLYALNSQHRGNMLVRVRVAIPTNLDPRQMDMVRQIQVGL